MFYMLSTAPTLLPASLYLVTISLTIYRLYYTGIIDNLLENTHNSSQYLVT